MKRLTLQQRKFVINSMVQCRSYHQCQRDFKIKLADTISKGGVQKNMRKWDEHCAIKDLHKGRSGRSKDVRTLENVEKVHEIFDNFNGRKSIRKISSITGISKTKTWRIMKEELKKFPYKPTVSQKNSDVQREKRLVFCQRLVTRAEEENFELKKIIFQR